MYNRKKTHGLYTVFPLYITLLCTRAFELMDMNLKSPDSNEYSERSFLVATETLTFPQ
jgi:hypothetical protein